MSITQQQLDKMVAKVITDHPTAKIDTDLLNDPERLAEIIKVAEASEPLIMRLVERLTEYNRDRLKEITMLEACVYRTAPRITKMLSPESPEMGLQLSIVTTVMITQFLMEEVFENENANEWPKELFEMYLLLLLPDAVQKAASMDKLKIATMVRDVLTDAYGDNPNSPEESNA